VKSTTTASIIQDHIVYDLDVRAYNILRNSECTTPRILVLYLFPSAEADWLSQSDEQLELRKCACWSSLRGSPATTNTDTIRIRVPHVNRFSPEAINQLLSPQGISQ
jgi:hypothetical protein